MTGEEELPRVAFQGEPGAFSEEALLLHFGGRARSLPCRDFYGVGEAVAGGKAGFGILPVENTLAGSVQGASDVLAAGRLTVVGEVVLPIRHFLLGVPGAEGRRLRRILSHPIALAQCVRYLRARPDVEAVAVHDTAGAAKEVARLGDPGLAAIAPEGAAGRYGLEILAADLQDRNDNQTRFYVIRASGEREEEGADGATLSEAPGGFKTVVLLELLDRPGALVRVLEPFAARGIDLSRIESRPAPIPWRYRFILELRAHRASSELRDALEAARAHTSLFQVLGSFPAARETAGPGHFSGRAP